MLPFGIDGDCDHGSDHAGDCDHGSDHDSDFDFASAYTACPLCFCFQMCVFKLYCLFSVIPNSMESTLFWGWYIIII